MAALRGGETLHWLLQHQQCEVPAIADTPQKRQGEQTVAAEPKKGPLKSKNSGCSRGCSAGAALLLPILIAAGSDTTLLPSLSEQMGYSSCMIVGESWVWI